MQTTHDSLSDRRLEPRRLVPRRRSPINNLRKTAKFLEHFHSPNLPIFQSGDILTFKKADGAVGNILIIAIDGEEVDAIFYDGMPHRFRCSVVDVASLRVTRIEEAGSENVEMYRGLVGLHS